MTCRHFTALLAIWMLILIGVPVGCAGAVPGAIPIPLAPTAPQAAIDWAEPVGTASSGTTGSLLVRRTGVWNLFESVDSAAKSHRAIDTGLLRAGNAGESSTKTVPAPKSGRRDAAARSDRGGRFDAAVVAQGRAAFEQSCSQCHDTQRALNKTKSFASWMATVRRMARMDDAEIDASDLRPIATYLASRNQPAGGTSGGGATTASTGEADAVERAAASFSGTVAPLWRGGNDNLENPDFFVDAWLRADWQPTGPLSGRVTACTSCHSDATGGTGFTLELVEAYARLDLTYRHKEEARKAKLPAPRFDASLRAGRLVVPFGAFAAMSHPGIYRTVTNPLMYIMGRSVDVAPPRAPVLPMPYSDEGVDLEARATLWHDVTATLDFYAVNGLKAGGPGVSFTASRSYVDNNNSPAVGGRATVGNRFVRFGGSVMSGQMQPDQSLGPELNYHFAGGDVVVHYEDRLRLYYEYAMRRNDSPFGRGEVVYGNVVEGETLLLSHPKISLLARYDDLVHRDFQGHDKVERFTWGVNTVLPGGSLLIVDHERWNFAGDRPTIDVVGLRWVTTF